MIESSPATTRVHLGRAWVELKPDEWQAYPLSINNPGTPHIIEVEFPSDIEQTLSISLIEPNAAGQVGPIGLDSGIDVSRPAAGHKPQVLRHRLECWPQTRAPYLLLVNRRQDQPAAFGRINVEAGPATLPPLAISSTASAGRVLAAYYDKPLIAENFSATEALDPVSKRGLDDWVTFFEGGERLIQTLQHRGFNAVVLTVACEGSAIYPSGILTPTPRYDSGVFFESGQDAIRKDVLELLFRMCDRSGLTLIPAIQFASPLAELELLRNAGGAEATGVVPIGSDGRAWMERGGGRQGTGVHYNALDPRVQKAMTAVVAELAEHYGQHASFGGVGVHLDTEGFSLLPDEACSLDEATFSRFLVETQTAMPSSNLPLLAQRVNFLRQGKERSWHEWRGNKLAEMYSSMRDEVVARRAGAKLYLTTANLLGSKQLHAALRPELPARDKLAEILPLVGLSLDRLTDEAIVIPRPQRIEVAAASQVLHDQDQHWNRSTVLDALFARPSQGSSLHFLAPAPLRLPEFDALSPFGADKTRTLLISQIGATHAAARERFVQSLARRDATLMIDGGWLMPLGQQAALAPLVKVFRRLPNEPFESVKHAALPRELVVRTLAKGDKTHFYAVNPTPWPLSASIHFTSPDPIRLVPYAEERKAAIAPHEGGATWSVELEPFDLVGGELTGNRAKVAGWSVTAPPSAAAALEEQIRDVTRRAHLAHDAPRRIELANASFETPAAGGIPNWMHASGLGQVAEIDRGLGSASRSSLHLVNRGSGLPLWVRSDPFAPTKTGRIQVVARMRTSDVARQPQFRMAIEGKHDGQVYYRPFKFGAKERAGDSAPPPLTNDWSSYAISITDLPVADLTELRVGFDLMSDGEVWIDEVQVFDLWLEDGERSELLKGASTAKLQVGRGELHECHLFVDGYWPSFLRRNVSVAEPAPAAGPVDVAPIVTARPRLPIVGNHGSGAGRPKRETNTADRTKTWWPSWMKWK